MVVSTVTRTRLSPISLAQSKAAGWVAVEAPGKLKARKSKEWKEMEATSAGTPRGPLDLIFKIQYISAKTRIL